MAAKRKTTALKIEPTVSRPELLEGESDSAFRQFVHDTLAFSARLQAVRGQIGSVVALSGTHYTVLIAVAHLSRIGRKIGVNQVAEHLHFSGAFTTIAINKLVIDGLVDKTIDEADRRRVILTTTPKARALLKELASVQRPVNDMLFRDFSASDFKKIRKLMSGMVETADNALRLLEYNAPATLQRPAK